jgi:hypothetical protein
MCTVAPHLAYRSQSENAARELVGWTDHINLYDMQKYYGSFSITPEYTRSFRPYTINQSLFGNSLYDCKRINITGMGVPTRNATKDWAAEHFYLSDAFQGELCFRPRIQNFLVDFNLYFGLDNWAPGIYARIHAPVVWTKWDLHATEKVRVDDIASGNFGFNDFWAGDNINSLLTRFFDYSCHEAVPTAQWGSSTNPVQNAYPLTAAKICPCSKRKAGLSDIQADLGWNYLGETYHIGLFVRAVAPTGTRPNGEFLFEPIIGNGKHWELGGGITSHTIMWESDDAARTLGLYIDANLTHMFKSKQKRVFDIKKYGQLSRYMLVAHYDDADLTIPAILTPAANLTLQNVKVSVGIHADVVAMLTYTSYNTTWDIGYNFWGRSCEKICLNPCSCSPCTLGLDINDETWSRGNNTSTIHAADGLLVSDPAPLSTADLDINGARTKGLSHKIFTHISYSWLDHGDWIPFLGLGLEGEFGSNSTLKCCKQTSDTTNNTASCFKSCNNCCKTKCCCIAASLSQWGIWVKGGISF